jgi:hypothetical protein
MYLPPSVQSASVCFEGTGTITAGISCLLLRVQGYTLEERLLEFRCGRYFYVDGLGTFLPVPDAPKDFNKQLRISASALSATQDPR